MHRRTRTSFARIQFASLALGLGLGLAIGCSSDAPTSVEEETGFAGPFDQVPEEGRFDGSDALGPRVSGGSDTEVWAVRNQWSDAAGGDADAAGLAWEARSGLTWEQKFDRWVESFEAVARQGGSGRTFRISTPYGDRSMDAPTLECAEVALFLRLAFASWYGLPFYLSGWDAESRQPMYAGHFGFVTREGARLGRFPSFRTAYRDHTSRWSAGQAWPSDARLRGMRLGTDDAVRFLSTEENEVGAGAYFDEMFLNKRVGYFARLVLLFFGSTNLADGANTFHVVPEHTAAGDILVHRWQRRGIGHVMPIMRRSDVGAGHFELQIASGSMPRRQPVWEDASYARNKFTSNYGGGTGETSEGDAYASLGGGVRRWRMAVLTAGRWRNIIPRADAEAFIADADAETIAARPATYGRLLAQVTPEERRDVAVAQVQAARDHLRRFPASCAARERREDAFDDLYTVMDEYFGDDRAAVDARFRTREDRVMRELDYARSRTCCWNSSTAAMFEIALAYADQEAADAEARGECMAPTTFRAEAEDLAAGGDGFGRWRAYAVSIGRGDEWRTWSEDEACAQRDLPGDTMTARGGAAPVCGETPVEPPPSGEVCDPETGDSPVALERGVRVSGRVCASDEDFFLVEGSGSVTVTLDFMHSAGDLDLQARSTSGAELASSTTTGNQERITAEAPFIVRVYGYSGAIGAYTIIAE